MTLRGLLELKSKDIVECRLEIITKKANNKAYRQVLEKIDDVWNNLPEKYLEASVVDYEYRYELGSATLEVIINGEGE